MNANTRVIDHIMSTLQEAKQTVAATKVEMQAELKEAVAAAKAEAKMTVKDEVKRYMEEIKEQLIKETKELVHQKEERFKNERKATHLAAMSETSEEVKKEAVRIAREITDGELLKMKKEFNEAIRQ